MRGDVRNAIGSAVVLRDHRQIRRDVVDRGCSGASRPVVLSNADAPRMRRARQRGPSHVPGLSAPALVRFAQRQGGLPRSAFPSPATALDTMMTRRRVGPERGIRAHSGGTAHESPRRGVPEDDGSAALVPATTTRRAASRRLAAATGDAPGWHSDLAVGTATSAVDTASRGPHTTSAAGTATPGTATLAAATRRLPTGTARSRDRHRFASVRPQRRLELALKRPRLAHSPSALLRPSRPGVRNRS